MKHDLQVIGSDKAVGKFTHKPRLANSRLANDGNDLSCPLDGLGPARTEKHEFTLAACDPRNIMAKVNSVVLRVSTDHLKNGRWPRQTLKSSGEEFATFEVVLDHCVRD